MLQTPRKRQRSQHTTGDILHSASMEKVILPVNMEIVSLNPGMKAPRKYNPYPGVEKYFFYQSSPTLSKATHQFTKHNQSAR